MAFADPQSVKISGTTTSLPRVESGVNKSKYTSADGLISLSAGSQYGNRTRRTVRLDVSKISPDVFVPSTNVKLGTSCYVVFDLPTVGFTNAELKAIYDGFVEALQASSSKLITQVLGGES